MLNKADMHQYQLRAAQVLIDNSSFLNIQGLGLGKTVAALTAISELSDQCMIERVLVITPKLVGLSTWPDEIRKWSHLQHLKFSVAIGTKAERISAIESDSLITIINRENVVWLVEHFKRKWPYDMVVIDESSSFKSNKAKRFKALKKIRYKMDRVVLLTGTPAPNSLLELWSQLYLLDYGERLGKTFTGFRGRYFESDYMGFKWKLRDGCEKVIQDGISDISMSMRVEDYLELPDKIEIISQVEMSDSQRVIYNKMKKTMVAEVESSEITAISAGVLCNKLQQLSQGSVYDEDRNVKDFHDLKLDMLSELIEAAQGEPVIVAYNYKHDAARIKERFPKAVDVREKGAIESWNKGEISILLAHPMSAGHGLNLQAGGHRIIWFGLSWSLELWLQLNGRLHRQGQTHPVTIHAIICKGTIDEDIWMALKNKKMGMDRLIDAVKYRIMEG